MTIASTPKGERRRQMLIEAAAALLSESGFDAIRHRAVAERAGLPLASTTYYFDSLEELVTAATERLGRLDLELGRSKLARLDPVHRETADLVELVLEQLLGTEVAPDRDLAGIILRYERLVVTARRPYLRALTRRMAAELRHLIQHILARSGVEVSLAQVEHIIVVVDGTVVNALVEAYSEPRAAARKVLLTELTKLQLNSTA
jgi:DNA-binding transcriptional regulator YbjK